MFGSDCSVFPFNCYETLSFSCTTTSISLYEKFSSPSISTFLQMRNLSSLLSGCMMDDTYECSLQVIILLESSLGHLSACVEASK